MTLSIHTKCISFCSSITIHLPTTLHYIVSRSHQSTMGCKHSTVVKVQPVGPPSKGSKVGKEISTNTPTMGRKNLSRESTVDEYELDAEGNKIPRKKRSRGGKRSAGNRRQRSNLGSQCSLDDETLNAEDRGFSATSKASADSGLGDGADAGEEDLSALGIITEYSDEKAVRMVEDGFIEQADLGEH